MSKARSTQHFFKNNFLFLGASSAEKRQDGNRDLPLAEMDHEIITRYLPDKDDPSYTKMESYTKHVRRCIAWVEKTIPNAGIRALLEHQLILDRLRLIWTPLEDGGDQFKPETTNTAGKNMRRVAMQAKTDEWFTDKEDL